ncbi:MAG TPA: cytochrome c3 family protein [Polyangiaceae bacterium]|nr:cytochrome c3 family protein [Polyangiaceae bacterium]
MALAGWLAIAGGVAVTLWVLHRHEAALPWGLFGLGAALAALCLWSFASAQPRPASAESIRVEPPPSYASSAACRSCHPGEYQSWQHSYHRSMTEQASAASVRAPWQGTLQDEQGRHYRLFRSDDQFWVKLPDPDRLAASVRRGQLDAAVPQTKRRVVMTTGSHHYQAYWLPGRRGNELWQLPFVYHFESQRFLPRRAVFLEPPDDPPVWARWNSSCVQCHSVAGQPRHDLASDRFATSAAELGIACEACHGPGAAHIERQHNPLTRYRARRSGAGDPSIINPARLGAERASEICGQCHSYFVPKDAERWWQSGFAEDYRPGEPLGASRRVLDYERDREQAPALIGSDLDSLFYADGTVRVGGREWNGLRRSACFERGQGARQLGCLSCHELHGGTRDAQLSAAGLSDAACANCHAEIAAAGAAHSHHAESSSGSACVNCHMPYTSYALLGAVRSHRITKPSAAPATTGLSPNACNGCHLDHSLEWTRGWLERWYSSPPSSTQPGPAALPGGGAAALALLSGDAATRVVVAAQLGWEPAQRASGSGWQAQLLVAALDDPYAAVRFVAARSLRGLRGFAELDYDFIADRGQRLAAQERARARAEQLAQPVSSGSGELTLDAAGRFPPELLIQLARSRDPRPVRIAE